MSEHIPSWKNLNKNHPHPQRSELMISPFSKTPRCQLIFSFCPCTFTQNQQELYTIEQQAIPRGKAGVEAGIYCCGPGSPRLGLVVKSLSQSMSFSRNNVFLRFTSNCFRTAEAWRGWKVTLSQHIGLPVCVTVGGKVESCLPGKPQYLISYQNHLYWFALLTKTAKKPPFTSAIPFLFCDL